MDIRRWSRVELHLKHDISLIGLLDMFRSVPYYNPLFPFLRIISGIVFGGQVNEVLSSCDFIGYDISAIMQLEKQRR
jgi:hypothetical protein